ncbi:MAG: carbamoyltransferase C-terminal domain-containing protein [Candidatus Orphnella occulta]|nr:carbamoyltransferase C-terminal domain-containing protein [Candidatus Orphnella occulta]
MAILSISDNHNSGVCLLKNKEIVFAVNEESLAREKLKGGFPYLSIKMAMEYSNISPNNIEYIIVASQMTPSFILRLFEDYHNSLRYGESSFSYLLNLYIIYQVIAYKLKLPHIAEKVLSGGVLRGKIAKLGIRAKIILVDHHYAHAASAYYTSGNGDNSLVFTADAMGDALSVTVNIGQGPCLKRIYCQTGFSAISTYYSRLTEFLGFKPLRHEGKITGLAGHGKHDNEIIKLAKDSFRFVEEKKAFNTKNHIRKESMHRGMYAKLKKYSKENIAYNFQKNFEDQVVKFVSFWMHRTDISNVILSGGVFANVSLNKKISEIKGISSCYIFPHMGDGGLSMGAALAFQKHNPRPLESVYLGPQYTNEYIRGMLRRYADKTISVFVQEELLCEKIARSIFSGKTVAHFNGRMEYGPRALGNRSILYRADDPTCNKWLNRKLQRSHFMPFAPMCLKDEFNEMFEAALDKTGLTLQYMNIAVDCKQKMINACPGVVHVDNTARPQIIDCENNPRLFKILSFYRKLKDTSVILNTSFNKHEEPIVCSPEDAIDSFLRCGLDMLILNNYFILRK